MENEIRIAGIVKESIVDGPGIRMVVFTQGCKHNCPGCHNPHTHSFDGGEAVDVDYITDMLKKNPLLDGITLSGGEPFEQAGACAELARKAKDIGLNVLTYTGYTYEHLQEQSAHREDWARLLQETDILIDGRFEIGRRNLLLKFKGSENQRVIDVKATRHGNRIVLIE